MTQITHDIDNRVSEKESVQKYLTFLLNDKTFAVSILKVKEILEYCTVTPIPKMPDYVCGAINLRGKVVPVVDLTHCLNQETSELTKRSCIVIIEMIQNNVTVKIGIIVDAVSKVLDFHASDIERAPELGENINTDFIEGMGKIGDQFVVMLNVDKIISMEEFDQFTK